MQTPSFDPNDPRLTAFAFGELDDADKDVVEQLLSESEEAREALKEIEETVGLVRDELLSEPSAGLTTAQRDAIRNAASVPSLADALHDPVTPDSVDPDSVAPMVQVETTQRARSKRTTMAIAGSFATTAVIVIAVVIAQNGGNNDQVASTDGIPSAAMHADQVAGNFGARKPASDDAASVDENVAFGGMGMAGFADEASRFKKNASNLAPGKFTAPGGMKDQNKKAGFAGGKRDYDDAKSDSKRSKDFKQRRAQPKLLDVQAASADQPEGQSPKFGNTVRASAAPATNTRGIDLSAIPADKPRNSQPLDSSRKLSSGDKKGNAQPSGGPPKQAQSQQRLPERAQGNAPGEGRPSPNDGRKLDDAKRGSQVGGGGVPENKTRSNNSSEKTKLSAIKVASVDKQKQRTGFGVRLGNSTKAEPTPVAPVDPRKYQENNRARPGNESFDTIIENEFIVPKDVAALSTFAVDVDTASYANVRRFLNQDQLPPKNAVRVEELINYFKYNYKQPQGDDPFSVDVELAQCPWAPEHRLARVGLQAKTIAKEKRPRTNLVFLIDESGSMRANNKLPLVKTAMKMLVEELTEDDQVSIVTYSSTIKVPLAVTSGAKKNQINSVIRQLNAGGSTNGSGGIQKAYDVANKHFLQDSSNRVILCTDGDFNVGISKDEELVAFIKEKAASGVFLSVFGFGMGNLKDGKLEKLADKGNGQYGYIDSEKEASKVFQDQLMGTLYTVAKDVKVQVDFNYKLVGAYRLIGYENRQLAAADFRNDSKDAGEIGAGHSVTALYEIVPTKAWAKRPKSKPASKYQQEEDASKKAKIGKYADELFTVRLSYKEPDEEKSNQTLDLAVKDIDVKKKPRPSDDFMFTASVAAFGMNLRGSQYKGSWNLTEVQETAEGTIGDDPTGIRREFVKLVKTARRLSEPVPALTRPAVPRRLVGTPKVLSADDARNKATVGGKYRRLLKKIAVANDVKQFGEFYDYGKWEYNSYAGHTDLPKGNWVYVYPNWYIWAEQVEVKKADPVEGKKK
jgi:Ca-activated chloride channel homolog